MAIVANPIADGTDYDRDDRTLATGYRSIPTNQVKTFIRVNGILIDNDFGNAQYNTNDTTNTGVRSGNNFINVSKGDLINAWRYLLQDHTSGSVFNESYVQPINAPLGKCSSMLVQASVAAKQALHELFPTDTTGGTPYNYTVPVYEAIILGGLAALPMSSVASALTFCSSFYLDTAVNQGKYTIRTTTGAPTSNLLQSLSVRTFATDSPYADDARAMRVRQLDRPKIEVGGAKLAPVNQHAEGWTIPIWERFATSAADALQLAGRTTAGALCAGGGPVASAACAGTVDIVANSLRSLIGIESSDVNKPSETFLKTIRPEPSTTMAVPKRA
jgi:hypothetical protein